MYKFYSIKKKIDELLDQTNISYIKFLFHMTKQALL